VTLPVVKQHGTWTQWRIVRAERDAPTVALLERDVWAAKWIARRLAVTSAEESIEIDSLRDCFNAGLLISVPGQPAFCTLCVKPLSAPPRHHGRGLMQCTECGRAIAIHRSA
jgi:hypothetical protein